MRKEGKAFQWKRKKKEEKKEKRRKQSFLIYIKKNKSGIVYIVHVEVAQAWYKGAAIDDELLDHEFSGSY